ncbi:MAG: hypothetical protein RL760_499 [Candidatus Eisenbacteria bacterium]
MIALLLADALSAVRVPQTTADPATGAMRDAWLRFQGHLPYAAVALVIVLVLLLAVAMRVGAARRDAAATEAPARGGWIWVVAPFVLVALAVWPAFRAFRTPEAPAQAPLRVNVVAHQWWWEARYDAHHFATATDVHVPVGRPVELVLESADVMHSLWIPAIGPRQDVSPLRRRTIAFTPDRVGRFPGQCAELCGSSHANMHFNLFVDDAVTFDAWLANQQAPPVEPTDSVGAGPVWSGKQEFIEHACRGCHTVRGVTDGPIGPDLTHFASRTTIAGGMYPRTDSTLAHWLLKASTLKQGSTMPGFPIPAKDLHELILWLQSLK